MTEALQTPQSPSYAVSGEQPRRVNAVALTAFVVVFFASVVGLVLGYVALRQVERAGEAGRGLALAAIVLGWVGTLGFLLLAVGLITTSWVFKIF